MSYPAFLESFWITHTQHAVGAPERETALRRLEPKVQALSDLFTAERPDQNFPDYFADRSLLAGYGVFFFPQSFTKATWALDFAMQFRGWRARQGQACAASDPRADAKTEAQGSVLSGDPLRILDLGSGAGPCGLGLALTLHEAQPARAVHLTALDHSPHALAALKELAKLPQWAGWLTVETVRHDLKSGVLPALGAPYDLLIAGFALNELFVTRTHEAQVEFLRHLRPLLRQDGLVILLEPAFKPTAQPLTRLSDALALGPEFFRWGPQLSNAPCPFLAEGGKYWDHEVRLWTPPDSLEFVNRRLFRDIATLKFSCAILGASPPAPLAPAPPSAGPEAQLLRLVSPMTPLKGRFVFAATTATGQKISVQVPLRGMSRQEEKEFESRFERGDIVACTLTALKDPGLFKAETLVPVFTGKK